MTDRNAPNNGLNNGLSEADLAAISRLLLRTPEPIEIGIFAAMWSEHCAYRSSKPYLRRLYSKAAHVIEGPGENAGVVDIGDGLAAVFKMESHNHPSFLEPYQGAATGIGGIMRDIFTMGARPIAFLNALRFGAVDHPKTPYLLAGVVAGIGGYGNCVGVPTVGGEVDFDESYNGNILVNAMCVGIAERDKIFRSRLEAGCKLIYVGARTGHDGIHGAMMASSSFDGDETSRTSVQIGDPFMQKLLLECCLEMMASGAIIGLQDMGAAGLTSASVEMAAKSGLGVELDLDRVPCREQGMSAYEIMLSESQERMLIAIRPEAEAEIHRICKKWDIPAIAIGSADDSQHLRIRHGGRIAADIPIKALMHGAPPLKRAPGELQIASLKVNAAPQPLSIIAALKKLLATAELSSRRWIAEQYDHTVMGDTLQASGGDAALMRVHGTDKALALTTEATPRYCQADPFQGAKQAVAECFRNLIAVGATPLAITDCLNFASPQDAEVMGQFAAAIDGMNTAAAVLDMPIVSGNVSFYNETDGRAIIPTPVIGGLGLIADYRQAVTIAFEAGMKILLVGNPPNGFSGQTLYQKYICEDGEISAPPFTDLEIERQHGLFLRDQILAGRVKAAHDIGSGGLAIALAEMALASGCGITIDAPDLPKSHDFFFAEDQARYVIACRADDLAELTEAAREAETPLTLLGESGGDALIFEGEAVALFVLDSIHRQFLIKLMEK